jgi:phage gpG-like protein
MATGLQAQITRDDVSPSLGKLDAALHQLRPILQSVGLEVVSITQQSFQDASFRIAPWAPKRDGSPATLIKSGLLKLSIRITNMSDTTVTVGSDRIYAAIQQLGGTIVPKPGNRTLVFKAGGVTFYAKKVTIPPRPFFPIDSGGNLSSLAQRKIAAVLEKELKAY